jgi:hypothetical protein
MAVKRKVVSTTLVRVGSSRHAGTRLVTLECGHVERQKRSMPLPVYKFCNWCKEPK